MAVPEAHADKDLRSKELKASLSALDGQNVRLSKDLGAALKKVAALEAVDAENAELERKLAQAGAKVAALEAALAAAKAKEDKADAIIAAGKAIKEGLRSLA